MRRWGEKIKVRNKGREDHHIRPEPKPLPPTQTHTNIWLTLQTKQTIPQLKTPKSGQQSGRTRGVNKDRKRYENCVEKLKKQPIFYVREGEVRSVYFTNKPMILLVYKEAYINTNDLDHIMPSAVISLLREFDDMFLDDTPSGLPPLREIEHQIDFVPRA